MDVLRKRNVSSYGQPRLFSHFARASDGQLEINKHKGNADYRCRNEIKPIHRPLKLELKLIIQISTGKNDGNSLITQKLIDVIV